MAKKDTTKKDEKTEATEVAPAAFEFTVIKHVTMPTLKLMPDVPVFVKILEKIFEGKTQPAKGDDPVKKAPWIFNVINLETGENCQMVAGTVVQREIQDTYPEHAYVEKCFVITKGKKKGSGDRGYFTYSIAEIAEPEEKESA